MFSRDRLHACLGRFGVHEPGSIFAELDAAYGAAGRFYHDGSHVAECLTYLDRHSEMAEQPDELELAIWFHDAIYDSTKPDNEEQSAVWAVDYLRSKSVAPDSIARIDAYILATKTHQSDSPDCSLLLDIDLGILGASSDAFERYDVAIRREYEWVPEEQYRSGRAAVLGGFLERSRIYETEVFFAALEEQARSNLTRKIQELAE